MAMVSMESPFLFISMLPLCFLPCSIQESIWLLQRISYSILQWSGLLFIRLKVGCPINVNSLNSEAQRSVMLNAGSISSILFSVFSVNFSDLCFVESSFSVLCSLISENSLGVSKHEQSMGTVLFFEFDPINIPFF